jgi:hypothetical protein
VTGPDGPVLPAFLVYYIWLFLVYAAMFGFATQFIYRYCVLNRWVLVGTSKSEKSGFRIKTLKSGLFSERDYGFLIRNESISNMPISSIFF